MWNSLFSTLQCLIRHIDNTGDLELRHLTNEIKLHKGIVLRYPFPLKLALEMDVELLICGQLLS